jgi:hypothetical protein
MAKVRHIGLFPWCPTQATPTSFDIQTSLSAGMAAWWRVSKWRFSIEYTGTYTQDGNTFDHGSLTDSYILERSEQRLDEFGDSSSTINYPVSSESDLVCDKDGGAFTFFQSIGNSSPSGSFGFEFRIMGNPVLTPVQLVGTNSFLDCYFSMNTVLTSGSLGSKIEDGPNLTEVGEFTFSVAGTNVTKPINLIHTRSGTPDYSCNASIEAHEYWPYDPNDGLGPVYDTTTGDQLRPFSPY